MKATLVVRSKDNSPVILNAREVIADCHSIDPEKNLDSFSVAGKKVVTNMPVQMNQIMDSEMDQMDMMMRNTEEQIFDPRNERTNMMRGNMGMKNMINQRNQPMQVRNPMMDFDDELDMDYMQYTDELQNIAAAMFGAASSAVLITSLSLTAELIGPNTESSAFVYGAMSFTDKVSNGFVVMVIQHFIPCLKCCALCKWYFRDVLFCLIFCLILPLEVLLYLD